MSLTPQQIAEMDKITGFTPPANQPSKTGMSRFQELEKTVPQSPVSSLRSKFADRVGNVKSAVSQGIEAGKENAPENFASGATKMINAGLSIPGQAIGAVGDVIGAGLEATGLDEPIAKAMKPIVESAPVRKLTESYQTLPQETRDLVGNVTNVASVIPVVKGGQIAKDVAEAGVKATGQVARNVSNQASKLLSKTNPSEAKAIENTYNGIMDIVENKKSLLKSFSKSEGTGKDPIKIIAENPDYMVKINEEARTIDAADSITNMKRDVADFSTVRDSLLATADEILPAIPTNKIIEDTLNKFSAKNYSTYLDEGEKAVKDIITKLQTLKKYNPETVSRVKLNNIRKSLDETINSFTDTKLKDRMRADLRTVFKNNLEQSIPESGLLSDLNSKIGDLLDASNFLEKNLNGTKVKGGGLTDLALKATGATIGATGLGGAVGGIPGAIGGYLISDFISKTLIKNAINNPFDRAVLEKLKAVRPDVVKRAEDYIKDSSPSESPLLLDKPLQELQVPSVNTTPKKESGKWKSPRGMIDFDAELFPKKQPRDAVGKFSKETAVTRIKDIVKTALPEEESDMVRYLADTISNPRVKGANREIAREDAAKFLQEKGLFDYEGELTPNDDELIANILKELETVSDNLELVAKDAEMATPGVKMIKDKFSIN